MQNHCCCLLKTDIDHWGWIFHLNPEVLCVCVCVTDRDRFVRLSSSLWLSVEWVLESHGYLSAGWRRKHNPEEEGCCYQSVRVGLRERSADERLQLHISNCRSLCLPISLFSLCLFLSCTLTSPGSLFTAEFRIALQCLRWLLCCKHTKVWYDHGSLFVFLDHVSKLLFVRMSVCTAYYFFYLTYY